MPQTSGRQKSEPGVVHGEGENNMWPGEAQCCVRPRRLARRAGTPVGGRTELMYASCPRNFRMMLPVDTSHRNTWRSPPHEANLQEGSRHQAGAPWAPGGQSPAHSTCRQYRSSPACQ